MSTPFLYIQILRLTPSSAVKTYQENVRTIQNVNDERARSSLRDVIVDDIVQMPGRLTIDCDYEHPRAVSQNKCSDDPLSAVINDIMSRCAKTAQPKAINISNVVSRSNIAPKSQDIVQYRSQVLKVPPKILYVATDYIGDDDL